MPFRPTHLLLVAVVATLLAGSPHLALAADEPQPPPATNWYGWQMLPGDALAVGTLAVLFADGDGALDEYRLFTVAALGVYVAGGPLLHLGRSQSRRALGSLGLRVGLPVVAGLLGGVIGYATTPERDPYSGHCNECASLRALGGSLIGGGVGVLAAILVDDFKLAREPVHARSWTVTAAPVTSGFTLGVAGRW